MGQQRQKIIETAIEPEKAKQLEKETAKIGVKTTAKVKERPPKLRSRRYKGLLYFIDKAKSYSSEEAVDILKKSANTKFDQSVEVHINLNFQKDKGEHQIRTNITLPHQFKNEKTKAGKKTKVLVFTSREVDEIKNRGADIGNDATLKEIGSGKVEYDKIIADSSWMPKLAKVAKILGPKGLMPNPKSGTVTNDPLTILSDFSKGKLELRTEKLPIIHAKIGKISFDKMSLIENFNALIDAVKSAKPEGFKRPLFKSIYLSSTMGPSIKVDLGSI